MLPVTTGRKNFTYKGPSPDIGDLDGEIQQGGNAFFSWWKPSPEELEVLNDGGLIELGVWQHPIPPFAINAVTKEEADGQ